MSCPITSGRTNPCRNTIGGLKAAFMINFVENGFTIDSGTLVVSAIDAAITEAFKYELKNDGNTFQEDLVSDDNAGTTVVNQVLTLALKKQTVESAAELNKLAKGYTYVIVQDRNDNYFLAGHFDGMNTTAMSAVSGGVKTDFNGYNITMNAATDHFAPYLDSATVTALLGIVSATNVTP